MTPNVEPMQELEQRVRRLKMVVGFIGGGTFVFLFVMVGLGAGEAPEMPVLSYASFGLAATAVFMRLVLPGVMTTQGRRRIAAGEFRLPPGASGAHDARSQLFFVFQGRTVIAAALLDGPALLCGIAYRMEGLMLPAVLGFMFCAAIAAGIPTLSGATAWLDEQERLLREEADAVS